MPVTDEEFKKYEESFKSLIFNNLQTIMKNELTISKNFEKMCNNFDINNKLSTPMITINNKIIELSNEFEEKGISFYASKVEDYGHHNINVPTSNLLADMIIRDLLNSYLECSNELIQSNNKLAKLAESFKQVSVVPSGFFTRFKYTVSNYFNQNEQKEQFNIAQMCREEISSIIESRNKKDNALFKYNIRDNVEDSIINFFSTNSPKYSTKIIKDLLHENIFVDLEKLGYSDLIPNIQERFIKDCVGEDINFKSKIQSTTYNEDEENYNDNDANQNIIETSNSDYER